MLEKEAIQSRGFYNIYIDGKAVGFQFNVRLVYYRGIFLSQLRPGKVIVDGEEFNKDEVIWSLGGIDYSVKQMKSLGDVHWNILDPMTIKIKKDGGLAQGYHNMQINYAYSSSYLPPKFEANLDPDAEAEVIPGFGGHANKRKLLLV